MKKDKKKLEEMSLDEMLGEGFKGSSIEKIAYINLLGWAVEQERIRDEFKKETGFDFNNLVISNPIINNITDYRDLLFAKFVIWVSETYWAEQKDCEHLEQYKLAKKEIEKFEGKNNGKI